MAEFTRGTAAAITFSDGVLVWDFSVGPVVTDDEAIIELLLAAGAIEVVAEVVEEADEDDGPMTVEEMTAGMTKDQIQAFALASFEVEVLAKPNKTRDEMLVELQAAIEAMTE